MTTRRDLLIALGAGAFVSPLVSFAQQQVKVWRLGWLAVSRRPAVIESGGFGPFMQGMRELGYVEGKNLVMESRFAEGNYERLPGLAAELVQLKVDVILASASQAIRAAQKATNTIPIVMGSTGDAVGSGFVTSLAHPGGNITGLSNLIGDLGPKHLEMLLSMVPKLSHVAVLTNPTSSTASMILRGIQTAANGSRVRVTALEARTALEIENAFPKMMKERVGAVIVVQNAIFAQQRRQIAGLAYKNRLPAISAFEEFVEDGGLMSYGPRVSDLYRRAATYVDKIFKGTKPADLPVEQPTRVYLVINRATAKAQGLTIPPELLVRAEKVIE